MSDFRTVGDRFDNQATRVLGTVGYFGEKSAAGHTSAVRSEMGRDRLGVRTPDWAALGREG